MIKKTVRAGRGHNPSGKSRLKIFGMRTLAKCLFLIPALAALHSAAQTLTTYSTLGEPGDTYNLNSGWLVNGSANPPEPYVGEAFAFTPSVSGYLTQLDVVISAGNGNLASDLANVILAANNNVVNLPFGVLERFLNVPATGQLPYNNPITTLSSSAQPFLQAGNTYWLEVEPANSTADIVVNQNSLGLLASQAQEFSASSWGAAGNRTTFAFDVQVTPVPEPSTTALVALGIALLICPLARAFVSTPPARA